MAKARHSAPEKAPDSGAFAVAGLDSATQALLEQAGELVIDGRLYVYEPPEVGAEASDDPKESGIDG